VIVTGRYSGIGRGVIRLKGKMSGRDFVREIPIDFSSPQTHDVLATLWARTRIDDLMSQDFNGAQRGAMKEDVKQSIVQLGLDYRLMTQFTSFVAVEEMIVTDGGQPRRIDVPIEVPEGVNRASVFGENDRPSGTFNGGRNLSGFYSNPAQRAVAETVIVTRSGSSVAGGKPVQGGVGAGGDVKRSSNVRANAPPMAAGTIFENEPIARNLSPEERKRAEIQTKCHPALLAVIDRLKAKNSIAGADESKFIHNGKAEIQIWFTDKSAETMAKLKELGFEIVLDPKTAKMVIGRLSIEKLSALAEITTIRYVAPQVSAN